MSLLPQRKKSAEELNQLRDQIGIFPQQAAAAPTAAQAPVPAPAPSPEPSSVATSAPTPAPAEPASRIPAAAPQAASAPKPVRSLRRSERDPSPSRRSASSSSFSAIPARRHNINELADMRRRQALAQLNTSKAPALFPFPAPRWVIVPGYLAALAGFACQYWQHEIPMTATASTAGVALLIALYILVRRPLSRHHAGFIAIITLLALTFAALHYFPYLRHAS